MLSLKHSTSLPGGIQLVHSHCWLGRRRAGWTNTKHPANSGNLKDDMSKMEGKSNCSRQLYRLSGTGMVERLKTIDVG